MTDQKLNNEEFEVLIYLIWGGGGAWYLLLSAGLKPVWRVNGTIRKLNK